MTTSRAGRRPGNSNTKEQILVAARREFAAQGFAHATVRQIATAAGVDPAMINHHFGTKQNLFNATLSLPFDPDAAIAAIVAVPAESRGEKLITQFLGVWDSTAGDAAAALLRTAVQNDETLHLIREFARIRILGPLLADLGLAADERDWRASLIATQILGLIFARYVFALPPLATASSASVIAAVAPTVQRYLTGPLSPEDTSR